jgi:hypothetical protein
VLLADSKVIMTSAVATKLQCSNAVRGRISPAVCVALAVSAERLHAAVLLPGLAMYVLAALHSLQAKVVIVPSNG